MFSPLAKDEISEFFSSPHTCSFTQTQDHHSNQPKIANCIADFQKSVEKVSKMADVRWMGSDKHLSGSLSTSSVSFALSEQVQWSYMITDTSQLSTEVREW